MPAPPWKRWYKTTRWAALRLKVFLRDGYTCQRRECGRLVGDTSQLVCNHKTPHRGDERLFWDEDNLETQCKPCHDSVTQREEQTSLHTRGVWH